MPNPSLNGVDEIVTTTLRNRTKKLADNMSANTALLAKLSAKENAMPFSGGRTILHELEYAENGTYKRYSGYETLNISPSDVFTGAEFEIKQAAVAVMISGLEGLQNAGPEQVIDLLSSRIKNAEKTMVNNLSGDLYSNGTADGGKQMGGMQLLVSDTGTGTVGGISANTWAFWQNYVFDFSANSLTPGSSTIQQAMNTAWLNTKRNRDKADLIVADDTYYNYYWSSLQAIQRITSADKAVAGFTSLEFMGAPVIADGGVDGSAPSAHMYFLNTDFIHYRPHAARNMEVIGGDRVSINQDAVVKLIGWAGNATIGNRRLQGVLVN
jgi:hypothetical protein